MVGCVHGDNVRAENLVRQKPEVEEILSSSHEMFTGGQEGKRIQNTTKPIEGGTLSTPGTYLAKTK